MKGIEAFLSERAIFMHREYVNKLKLRCSIIEKSYSCLSGKTLSEIRKTKADKSAREELIRLKSEVILHELYFSSFGEKFEFSKTINERFGSVASFLYNIQKIALDTPCGFLLIYECREEFLIYAGRDYSDILTFYKPILSIDLCEHAYLTDYGFSKDKYLERALAYLKLSVFDKNNR